MFVKLCTDSKKKNNKNIKNILNGRDVFGLKDISSLVNM